MTVRLGVVDEMFLRTHRGLGIPVVMQGLWRTADTVDAAAVDVLCGILARGPLGRRVVRPRTPGARPRFVSDGGTFPVEYMHVQSDSVLEWADAQAALPVDPERGAGWRLSTAWLEDGGTVLSLVCSHVLADARGLAAAIAQALEGYPGSGATPDSEADTSDVRDAALLALRVAVGTARAVAGLLFRGARRNELRQFMRARGTVSREVLRRAPVSAVLDVGAEQWDTVAEESGGTANSLFLTVVAGLARREDESGSLTLSVPMDVRDRENSAGAANSVAMVEVEVRPHDSVADVRAASRAAFSGTAMTSPAGFPEEMLQLVPDRVAYALTGNPGERDALCSNIGPLPESLGSFSGHRATGIATRAVHPGVVSSRTRLSAYLSRFDDRYTLALESLDDPDHATLRERAVDVLGRHGLTARYW
ncbi:MAG: hypothetical protein WAW17_10050 [Rhodococcus sp. (in: high G+C Gram-positive bacteria)]|uniref:hypothetical protein n=1 Tax=Rhodococcus sp. TaxID=1831 RepID=UPI003BB05B98